MVFPRHWSIFASCETNFLTVFLLIVPTNYQTPCTYFVRPRTLHLSTDSPIASIIRFVFSWREILHDSSTHKRFNCFVRRPSTCRSTAFSVTIRRYVKSDAFLTGAITTIVFGNDGNKSSFNSAHAPIYFAILPCYYLILHLVYEFYNWTMRWLRAEQIKITQISYLSPFKKSPSVVNINHY